MYRQQMKLVAKITGLWIAQLLARALQWALYGLGEITPDGTGPRLAMLEHEERLDQRCDALQQMIDTQMQTLHRLPWTYTPSKEPWMRRCSTPSLITAIVACGVGFVASLIPFLLGMMCYPMMRWVFQRPNGAYSYEPEHQDAEPKGPSIRWLLYWIGSLPEAPVSLMTWCGFFGWGCSCVYGLEALHEIQARKKALVEKLTSRIAGLKASTA